MIHEKKKNINANIPDHPLNHKKNIKNIIKINATQEIEETEVAVNKEKKDKEVKANIEKKDHAKEVKRKIPKKDFLENNRKEIKDVNKLGMKGVINADKKEGINEETK